MAADRITISFADGTTRDVVRRPVHWMRAEAFETKDTGAYGKVLLSLWAADTGGRGTRSQFEEWAEQVDDWDKTADADDPEGDARPPDQEPGTSPD